ncbi:hypothetical protein [Methanoregula sp.]|jgi:hypothetical protein|uniref:hypothetical protein n=1 Tax=Methanoregula sp. TaxID=2052170 RepID=UPI0025EFA36C|nr:hypothetical protein [Methanoregula sp.]
MKNPRIFFILALVAALIILTCPIQADTGTQGGVIYQTSFATNPQWTTNNPSWDYWDKANETYHFRIEPSTQNSAYSPAIKYGSGSFNLQYDVTLDQVDTGATFRLGFSGTDMDFNKGPNVVTEFTNAKYGQIMVLHVVTQSAKQVEVSSDTSSYKGPSVKYEVNTTYHVEADYNADTNVVTETVTNKATGEQLWSYYISIPDPLKGMNRIYIGSVGDYGTMNIYARGWIDNVVLTAPVPATLTTPPTQITTPLPTYSVRPTTKATTAAVLTPIPTTTRKSPSSGMIAIAALGIVGTCTVVLTMRKKR